MTLRLSPGRPLRWAIMLFVVVAISTAYTPAQPAGPKAKPKPAARGTLPHFLDTHCVNCHDSTTKEGGLDLETLSPDMKNPAAFEAWVKIHDRIASGEMPPRNRKERPTKDEAEPILKSLSGSLANIDRASRQKGDGRVTFRRLNRIEYENTLRDLLQVPYLKVKDLIPDDNLAHGFNKSSSGLDLSHVQLAQYLEAADVALDAATSPHAAMPTVYKKRLFPGAAGGFTTVLSNADAIPIKDFKYDHSMFPINTDDYRPNLAELRAQKKIPYEGTVGVFRHEDCAFRPTFTPFTASYAGKYRLRISLWSFWWDKGEIKPNPRTESASLIASNRALGYFDAPSLKPMAQEIEVYLNEGDEIGFNAASLWPVRVSERKGKTAGYVGPGIAIDWLEVEGPIVEQWPPLSHGRLWGDLPLAPMPKTKPPAPGDPRLPKRTPIKPIRGEPREVITYGSVVSAAPEGDATRLLKDFLRRAFRRPPTNDDLQRYVGLFRSHFEAGAGFEEAMRTAYKAVLCSPDFLYLKEPQNKLDNWSLASRLSYFLWNSMPDDDLLALAGQNKSLSQKDALRETVERMLKDPKAERFVNDFADQWLDLRDIDSTCPDRRLYPEFRPILRDAMLGETRAYLRGMLDHDLSVSHIVDSDFAMLNQRLAEHYRLPGIEGSAIRKVALPPGSHRGGLLTQASILKVTANGTTTSPVKRGAWVQRKVLGQPPDPPPADVPAIEPDVQGAKTVRELLDKHRAIPSCAGCHKKIDPPGFALESYDVIGGWQMRYRSLGEGDPVPPDLAPYGRSVGFKHAQPVDAAGETSAGQPFKNIAEFKTLLLADVRPLARNVAHQMLIYGTGAPMSFSDRQHMDKVLDLAAASRYGFRTLIHELVQSQPFLTK